MKSKERSWALTKEGLIHEVKKDHESSKSQKEGKKERNNNNKKRKRKKEEECLDLVRPENMQQGSWSG